MRKFTISLVLALATAPALVATAQAAPAPARPKVTVSVLTTGETGAPVVFKGEVSGKPAGAKAVLQRRTGDGWKTITSSKVKTSKKYKIRVKTREGTSKYRVRVTVAGAAGSSPTVVVKGRAAAPAVAAVTSGAAPGSTAPEEPAAPATPTPEPEPKWLTWLKNLFTRPSAPKPVPPPAPAPSPTATVTDQPSVGTGGTGTVDPVVQQILDETNAFRVQNGKAPLKLDPEISKVAQDWTQHMADNNAFHHNPSYSRQMPAGWRLVAENIAAGYAPSAVTKGWIDSPGHRANMLADHTHIGIGYVVKPGSGYTRYYTQNFGNYPGRG